MNDEPTPQPLEDFFPILARDESVRRFLTEEYGDRAALLIAAMETPYELASEFDFLIDALIEFISENSEEIDSFEFECLSSDSETSTVSIHRFSGIFWVGNLQFGDICYFASEEAARQAAEEFHQFGDLGDVDDLEPI
jgi:hypothetical protein